MNILEVLSDKSLKGVRRRQAIVDLMIGGMCVMDEVEALMPTINDKLQATVLEAIEEVTNKKMADMGPRCVDLAQRFVDSESNSCKREASRIIGNVAAQYPERLQESIALLMGNTRDESTVVRWSAAYALSRIVVLPEYAKSGLYDELVEVEAKEEENGVKSQLTKALKKASKMR